MSVNLIVKTPCLGEDREMKAHLDWKILRVKQEIEGKWPNRPKPEDQRLVYAGKLMDNESTLRELLRLDHDKDLESHTLHLVCRQITPPPNQPVVNEGLRKRTTAPSSSGSTSSTSSAPSTATASYESNVAGSHTATAHNPNHTSPSSSGYAHDVNNLHQTWMMQQMYAHYINHYMQFVHSQPQATSGHHSGSWTSLSTSFAHALQDPRGAAQQAETGGLNPVAAAAAAAAMVGQTGVHPHAAPAPEAGVVPPAPVAAAPLQPQQQPVINPNPANAVMNAGAAGGIGALEDDEDDIDGEGQRDVLDWFFAACRVLVFVSFVYLNSSLARFTLVVGLFLALYFYRGRFRGLPQEDRRNENNPNPAPNNEQQNGGNNVPDEDLIRQQVDEVRLAAGGGGEPAGATSNPPENQEVVAQPQAWCNVLATFVSSFFTSLIPHEPHMIQN